MTTILDQMYAQNGCLDPDLIGLHQARAGDQYWDRERGENEQEFIGRVLSEAAAQGYRVVAIAGALQIDNIVALRRPLPPEVA